MKIRIIDVETSNDGFPPDAGIVEIGWCDLRSTTTDLIGRPSGWIIEGPWSQLIYPGHAIAPATSAVHHIIDDDVAHAPRLQMVIDGILRPTDCIDPIDAFAAHSAKFERRFITDEMTGGKEWFDTYKLALRLFPESPTHSNQGLRYWRKPNGLDRNAATPAHRAGPDAYVTAFHLRDQMELAAQGQIEIADLIKWSGEPALQVTCHIGRQRGMKWKDVDDGFLYWLLDKDFDEDVLFTARFELDRREKERARELHEVHEPAYAEGGP